MIKAPRGTRDLLPPDTALWNFVEAAARDVFRAYNFHEIRTPVFESTELFARGVGEETDIVSKEMFTWYNGPNPLRILEWHWQREEWKRYCNGFERQNPGAKLDLEIEAEVVEFGYVAYKRVQESGERIPHALVRISLRPSASEVEFMKQFRNGWMSHKSGPVPKLILAYPGFDQATATRLQSTEVELRPVGVPNWFRRSESLTLRPENTAGVVRAYIEHNLWDRGLNKLYYIGPQFRRERPQKGRYRQFYQIGCEVIGPPSAGSESPARDAEVLEMLAAFLERIGITGWTLELNSVGCPKDRPLFNEALRKALEPVVGSMCADCQRRAVTNPLRVFDCKVPEDQPIIEKLPRISQFLDEGCRKHFEEVQAILDSVGVPFTINDRLVRGLDYYTRTAFEFTHGALGAQNAILGGGRYDGLSESLGGPAAPGIGFAIGEDRLVMSLSETAENVTRKPDAYIAPLGAGMNREAARLARELRRQDTVIELGDDSFRLKKSFEIADKLGARYILIVGENEVKSDSFALKNLATGEQVTVPRAELGKKIRL
jgi:histidyl-tRNA synthetase